MKTLLLNMPFATVLRPSMGLSILKARLREEGIECDVRYPNLYFAERTKLCEYALLDEKISVALLGTDLPGALQVSEEMFSETFKLAQLGDWLFAQHLWNDRMDTARALAAVQQHCGGNGRFQILQLLRSEIGPYLEACIEKFQIAAYDVIGFSTTLQQNMAALAFSRLIRERYPDKVIVFGGANCEGIMGLELHRTFPWIDYVFSGEADNSFPLFLKRLAAGEPLNGIPGVVLREEGRSVPMAPADLVHDMDALPDPDFDDYFKAAKSSPLRSRLTPQLLIETSRGCWWGAKQHCTFCGLNGETLAFRAKSAERVLAEVERQVARYGARHILAVDNIMPYDYLRTLLPILKERQLGVTFFYEIRPNLRRDQLQLMREAGVLAVQPGIESLSTHVLKLMKKGVTPIQNIQLLKWCREFGIEAMWNLIYGFPGETAEDYEEIARHASAIPHLKPPTVLPLGMDRFSPMFRDAEQLGIVDIRPPSLYKAIYPLPEAVVAIITPFFEHSYRDSRDADHYLEKIRDQLEAWHQNKSGSLYKRYGGESAELTIVDTRPRRPQRLYPLNGLQREVYEYCEEIRGRTAILDFVKSRVAVSPDLEPWLDQFLRSMEECQLMVCEEQQFLSVAVSVQGARKQPGFHAEHEGTVVASPEPPLASGRKTMPQQKPTGFAHTAFLVPVQDKWLLHAPLHKITALINDAAAGALRSGSAAAGMGQLVELIIDTPVRQPGPLQGDACPSFLGIIPARGCNPKRESRGPAQPTAQPTHMDPRIAVAAVDWMANTLARHGRKLFRVRFFSPDLFADAGIVETVAPRTHQLCSQLGLTPYLEASINGGLSESQCRFVGDYFGGVVLTFDVPPGFNGPHGAGLNGKPAFQAAADTARRLSQTPIELCLRASITQHTVGQMEEIARWMCQEFRPAAVTFDTPTPSELALNADLRAPDPYEFARHCIGACRIAESLGINALYSPAETQAARRSSCPVGTDALIVSGDGRASGCYLPPDDWKSRGMDLHVGWVSADGAVELDADAIARLRRLPAQKPRCRRCFCQWSCAGACHVCQTHPGCEADYTDFCLQTRLVTACLLLKRMGCDKVADELLADPQAMQRLARFPFDVFKVEPENLESRGTAADQERARAQDTGQPRPRSLIAEGMILLA
jgi:ribosomal peptide maturation radical SAM protein 1